MDHDRKFRLKKLAIKLGVAINDYKLFNTAFTHPTYVFENTKENLESNQRLEFLGDAVLGMIIAELLYHQYPQKAEGELTKMRAALVCEPSLAEIASSLHLGNYLLLGRGEEANGGRERVSTLADVFEAVIGALFLQNEAVHVKDFINKLFIPKLTQINVHNYGDYKTNLQEKVQEKLDENISYTIMDESGPDHNKSFTAGVVFRKKTVATGVGKSKKEAEQKAAQKALENLEWLEEVKV